MSNPRLVLRRAELRDSESVLAWRNDDDTVRHSLSGEAVDPTVHARWFREAISAPETFLLIAELVSESEAWELGMCRFAPQYQGTYEASINLAPELRGKGWGQKVLEGGVEFVSQADVCCREINAIVHESNPGSRRIFEKIGFTVVDKDGYWVHLRLLL